MKEKICKGCLKSLPIIHFNKSSNVKDGYENKCKECRRKQRMKYHTYTCINCGRKFSKIVKQTFCSNDCAGEYRRDDPETFEKRILERKGYKLLSPYETSRKMVKMKHLICGNEFFVTPNNFITKNSGCPKCFGNLKKDTETFRKEVYELVGNEYEVIGEYHNNRTPILMKHKLCGHEYTVTPTKFLMGRRCPNCIISSGEEEIKRYLEEKGLEFEREYIFENCRDKRPLPFDFAIFVGNKLIALIEFDGRHHYEPIDYWGGIEEFNNVKKRDAIKNEFCEKNSINLIRIPYYKQKEIPIILEKQLKIPMTIPSQV